jgi:hypothetical protein
MSSKTHTLTDRDIQCITAALQSSKTPLEIDFVAYAGALGLANAASGRTSWHNIKKKLGLGAGERNAFFPLG